MESTPSKRRKLSPAVSVPVDASLTSITPARASYMSPTRTSLARFHPNVLSKATKEKVPRNSEGRRSSAARTLNPTPLRTAPRRSAQLSASPTREPSLSPSGQLRNEAGFNAPPRRRSRTPGVPARPPSQGNEQGGPVTLNTEGAEEGPPRSLMEEEQLSQLVRRSARSTRGNRLARVRAEEELEQGEEPELPPTPEQLGLETRLEKPKGLLSSSPSGRVEKRRQTDAFGSSPSKLREKVKPIEHEMQDSTTVQEKAQATEQAVGKSHTHDEPELVRRQELLNQLSEQLESLRKDVSFLEAEVRRTQDLTHSEQDGGGSAEELISILTSKNPSNAVLPPPPKPKSLTMRLAAFLPFSKHLPLSLEEAEEAETLDPILSHRPLDLEDPLPHLKVFSPFNISSKDTLILSPSPEYNGPFLQQRDVDLKATQPSFSMKLRLVIDPQNQTVETVSLHDISPWADAELGKWIRKQAPSGDSVSIGWAAQNYLEKSDERSRCWAKCHANWPSLLRRSHVTDVSTSEQPEDDENQEEGGHNPIDIDNASSSSHMFAMHNGRQSLMFHDGSVRLLVSWRIGFTWTGETVEYHWLEASFPHAWTKADQRASLTRAKEAFRLLVPRVGVFGALENIVGVLLDKETAS